MEAKKEAINWIKEFNQIAENDKDPERYEKKLRSYIDMDVTHFSDSGYDEYSSHPFGNVINWIRHFFNITEEDLK